MKTNWPSLRKVDRLRILNGWNSSSRSVRNLSLLLGLIVCLSTATRSPAQAPDPGAHQDAQAAREKLLKASDELDNIQANSESTKASVDAMKPQITALQATVTELQTENAALKQQLADMQTAFDNTRPTRPRSGRPSSTTSPP